MTFTRPVAQFVVSCFLCAVLVGCSGQPSAPKPAFYTVAHYDESRDPVADLAMTVERATEENKRIFIQVGGNWCRFCLGMAKFIDTNESVGGAVTQDYLVMKVNYSKEHPNEQFLSQYPKVAGYPHVYILDTDGSLLHSQDTSKLETSKGYSEQRYLDFLAKWVPPKSVGNAVPGVP